MAQARRRQSIFKLEGGVAGIEALKVLDSVSLLLVETEDLVAAAPRNFSQRMKRLEESFTCVGVGELMQ